MNKLGFTIGSGGESAGQSPYPMANTGSIIPSYNPNSGGGYNSSNNTRIPQVIFDPSGGVTAYPDKLSTIMNGILSGLALVKGATQVPTTVSGQSQGIDANTLLALQLQQQGGVGSSGTALGKVENWLKNNTGVALMGAAAILLFYMRPPSKTR